MKAGLRQRPLGCPRGALRWAFRRNPVALLTLAW